ncbi:Olfactory receptor [Apodemus speciosus]|uniref:Olfactory receptor n=1 Tax=Apodemus speciosus TaxID=105296 RepID=A0ABQ0FW57_APOSI
MGIENTTLLTEFVLSGLRHLPQWKIPLFLFFLVIYLITIVGNLGLITLIWNDPHLHIPMYLFLGSLAFVDTWLSSTVTPRMLLDFFANSKLISFSECLIQFFSFGISATTECFLLAAMAYDRYVAICKPLLYPVIMTNRICIRLLTLSFVGGFIHVLLHEGFLLRLTFCGSNIISHFYCDIMPLLKISCNDPSLNYLMLFYFLWLYSGIQYFDYSYLLYTCSVFNPEAEIYQKHKESLLHLWGPSPLCVFVLWLSSLHVCAPCISTSRRSGYDGLYILHCYNSCTEPNYLQFEE